jgi:prephenate dehydratase/chorismate mutase
VGEAYLEVKQNLLSVCQDMRKIKKIYSHQQGIAQSREWLSAHIPHAVLVEVASTAEGARLAKGEEESAAIGSLAAAREYGIPARAKNIHGSGKNVTRFWIISALNKLPKELSGIAFYKTTCYFAIADKTGALCRLLSIFARYEISLSSIVSRPLPGKMWEYGFFIDYKVSAEDPLFLSALAEARKQELVKELHVFGSYPLYGTFPENMFAKLELQRFARVFSENAKIRALSKIPRQTIFKNPFLVQSLHVREMMITSVATAKFFKKAALFDKYREADIVSRLQKKAPQKYAPEIKRIYAHIFSRSRSIQKDIITVLKEKGKGAVEGVTLPLPHVRYYLNKIDDIIVYLMIRR